MLSLEKPDNKIEIVIHVNMLKEGWDVTNLYTIVPLRASASETLTEQTIGRGLRLPYGDRTGVDEVDRLSIVSHDKYEAIVNLANDPNSLVRRVYYIDPAETTSSDEQRVTVEMPTTYDELTSDTSYMEQLALTFVRESTAHYGTEQPRLRSRRRRSQVLWRTLLLVRSWSLIARCEPLTRQKIRKLANSYRTALLQKQFGSSRR